MEKERPKTIAVDRSELFMEAAHNYSIQSLNTTELAKEKLRQMMAKVRLIESYGMIVMLA